MNPKPIQQSIDPRLIRTDLGTQARNANSEETIREYAEDREYVKKEIKHRVSRLKNGEYVEVPLSKTNTDQAAAEIRHYFDDNYLAALAQSAIKSFMPPFPFVTNADMNFRNRKSRTNRRRPAKASTRRTRFSTWNSWHKELVPPDQLTPLPQKWIEHLPCRRMVLPHRDHIIAPDGRLLSERKLIYPGSEATRSGPLEGEAICDPTASWRCRKYVATMPKAVSGQGGHPTTLAVANAIFWEFGLDEQSGWPILLDYNIDCQPPWSEPELRHKMNDARSKPPPGKEFCWLLNAQRERYEYGDFDSTRHPVKERAFEDKLLAPKLTTFNREEMTFLWPNRFVNGKLNLLCGDGSVGKTWFLCYICSVISRGTPWPDGTASEQGGIIFFTSEDGAGDTLRPRIEDNGGDVDHIYVPQVVIQPNGTPKEFSINEIHSLARFIDDLEKQHGVGYVKLVIFDPITAFMGDMDEFKNNQVRATFRPMARLAEEKNFAWIGVGHPKKGAKQGRAKDVPGLSAATFTFSVQS